MTLPSHLISPAERSEALPHWRCPNVDTKETPLRDVLSHSTLSETSKDSAPHHFCHILLSPMWAPLLCKATKCHNQLASGQMITKASTHLPQATAYVTLLGTAAQEIFWHPIHTPNNHTAERFQRWGTTIQFAIMCLSSCPVCFGKMQFGLHSSLKPLSLLENTRCSRLPSSPTPNPRYLPRSYLLGADFDSSKTKKDSGLALGKTQEAAEITV